jgi:predicted Zn-dependent protease
MQDYFFTLADALQAQLRGAETLLLAFDGEDSDFIRFNRARVRQAGGVARHSLALDLIEADRHAAARTELAGSLGQDLPQLQYLLEDLRGQRTHLPADPYLNYATDGRSGESRVASTLPTRAAALEAIVGASEGLDLVGIWATGTIYTGFANSLGQRNWHTCESFNLDWSCYHDRDKAVKADYAGLHWDPTELQIRMQGARSDLEVIKRPPVSIEPGRYRVYLAPRALREVLDMMAWGGFGLKSQRTGQSPLIRMQTEGLHLDPAMQLSEHHGRGLEPPFTAEGFAKPERTGLVADGECQESLVCARSAREYDVHVNAAAEWPASLDMAPGRLAAGDVLDALDTGLYVNNLWYLNFSDRNQARITGMTRFACFWVEDGKVQAPINVMRFDDSLYRMLGENLLGLTRRRELLLDAGTYGGRSSHSVELPGALIEGLTFTL